MIPPNLLHLWIQYKAENNLRFIGHEDYVDSIFQFTMSVYNTLLVPSFNS